MPLAIPLALTLSTLLPVSTVEAQSAGMAPEDLYGVVGVADPRISPDGARVVFTVERVAEDARSRERSIWITSTASGAEPTRLTDGPSDSSPRWSPDGARVAYLGRDSEERAQLHLVAPSGGTPTPVTALRQGSISSFEWTPDGTAILLTLNLDPEVDEPLVEPVEPEGPVPDIVVVRDAVFASDEAGYLDERRKHLWVLDVQSGSLRALTSGDPAWNDEHATVSPDGGRVAFVRDASGEEYDGGFDRGLWFLALDGGTPAALDTPAGRVENPVWAPANDRVVYRSTPERYARPHLYLHSLVGGPRVRLTAEVDRRPENLLFHPSGRHLYFTADHQGTHPLYRLALDGSGATPLFGEDGAVSSPTISADGSMLAFTYENELYPPEIWVADAEGRQPRPLTRFNDELLAGLDLQRLEELRFQNPDGFPLQGFVLRPHGFEPGQSYPLVLNIKGGPGGMWGSRWFPEFHMLAAAGYGVAFVNYRGSSGYGHRHMDAVRRDYGGADATDNLLFLDQVLARHDWVDPERLFVTGGSHGGFLTAWLTTRTDRFRAAVPQRMVSNWISEAGTQAFPPRAMQDEFGGTIWERFDDYWGRSPLAHAPQVTTPTLVIHSTDDRVTPIGQGQEWFYALRALGIPSEMVIFEGESHALSRTGRPVNQVERIRRIIEWFDRWDERP